MFGIYDIIVRLSAYSIDDLKSLNNLVCQTLGNPALGEFCSNKPESGYLIVTVVIPGLDPIFTEVRYHISYSDYDFGFGTQHERFTELGTYTFTYDVNPNSKFWLNTETWRDVDVTSDSVNFNCYLKIRD